MQTTCFLCLYFTHVGLTDFDPAVQLSVLRDEVLNHQQQQQQYDQVGLYYMDNISKYVRQLDRAIAKLENFNQFAIENINILLITCTLLGI